MIARIKTVVLSKPVWVAVSLLGLVATATASITVNDVIPDNERMQTFGGFRDGTYSAIIAICSLAFSFAGTWLRENTNVETAKEKTIESKIQAEAMAMLGSDVRQSVERLENMVGGMIRLRGDGKISHGDHT